MKNKTLLERAINANKPKVRTWRHSRNEDEIRDLALAYINGTVSYSAVSNTVGLSGSAAYGLIAVSLRRAVDRKELKIIKK